MTTIMTANLNGIRAAGRKGFFDWLSQQNPDVLCVQETKAQMQHLDDALFWPQDRHCYYADAEKKGYSGVGILSRHKPLAIETTLGHPILDQEGRFIAAEFDQMIVCSLYLPSGTSGTTRQNIKFECMDYFYRHYLQANIASSKPIVICGDWNIAHQQRDLKNWRSNQKNSGFLPEERAWLDQCFDDLGWVDAFRAINQEDDQYTWWTYRANARANNVGWRIDYHVASPQLRNTIQSATIHQDPVFSDHAPLTITYDFALTATPKG